MSSNAKILGMMNPMGGGDPIPLTKEKLVIGRRPTCDIRLDFEKISGKHCELRLVKGVWQVKDLESTNGTTVNGRRISDEQSLMPDDELGIARRMFKIDYDPAGPVSLSNQDLDEEKEETPAYRRSLMEMAGLGGDGDEGPSPRVDTDPYPDELAKEPEEHPLRPEPAFDDSVPSRFQPPPPVDTSDDDFFKMIEEDTKGK